MSRRSVLHLCIVGICLTFSIWLTYHTVSFNSKNNDILVGAKYWSDFGSHLPLIRSFSRGKNWPPELPLYPGEPIKYHYSFYATVGFLEKITHRLDIALNLPSAFGIASLLLMVWIITYKSTRSYFAGIIALLLVFFNASFSWLDFLNKTSPATLSQFITSASKLVEFPSFRPWNDSLITAFWNWNVYSNQRHLGLSFAIVLVIVYILIFRPSKLWVVTGFLAGSLLLINQAAFVIACLALCCLVPYASGMRKKVIFSLIGALPWVVLYILTVARATTPTLEFGFLAPKPVEIGSFVKFWFANLGVPLVLIPLSIFIAPKNLRPLAVMWVMLWSLGNIFRLSPDVINNHKLFNFGVIIAAILSATVIKRFKLLVIVVPLCIAGGLIDFLPIIHDTKHELADYTTNPDIAFFMNHTQPTETVVNSTWFYHPASLAGRSIFNGYSYFTWSYGYDQTQREEDTKNIYAETNLEHLCAMLVNLNLSYVELNDNPESFLNPSQIWKSLTPIYRNDSTGVSVYATHAICNQSSNYLN